MAAQLKNNDNCVIRLKTAKFEHRLTAKILSVVRELEIMVIRCANTELEESSMLRAFESEREDRGEGPNVDNYVHITANVEGRIHDYNSEESIMTIKYTKATYSTMKFWSGSGHDDEDSDDSILTFMSSPGRRKSTKNKRAGNMVDDDDEDTTIEDADEPSTSSKKKTVLRECPICTNIYKTKQWLRRHMAEKHKEYPKYGCHRCKFAFDCGSSLRAHKCKAKIY